MSYKDVAKRSKTIREIVNKRIMPPWPADPEYSHFLGENFLSEQKGTDTETLTNGLAIAYGKAIRIVDGLNKEEP